MPHERTTSLDVSRDYGGSKAHTLRNGYTLSNAATPGKQAAVVNAAILHNAKLGELFAAADVFEWQEKEEGGGRQTLKTLRDHLESLVGKGFLVAVGDGVDCSYRVVEQAMT